MPGFIDMKIIGLILIAIVAGAIIAMILALPVMWLWNDLMPGLFKLPKITFGQALELSLLCYLLFKNSSASSKKD